MEQEVNVQQTHCHMHTEQTGFMELEVTFNTTTVTHILKQTRLLEPEVNVNHQHGHTHTEAKYV